MMKTLDPLFRSAVQCRQRVAGLTHSFYRYPARFSPQFAREAIRSFSEPGDIVLDPFMGGGTTLVEACALGRRAVGIDINSLSVFIAKVKTTVLSDHDLDEILAWAKHMVGRINLHDPAPRHSAWIERGYQRSISDRRTWPIRKLLEMALPMIGFLANGRQQRFARCLLLKTAQWALDCRKDIPRIDLFRKQLLDHVSEMIKGAREFAGATAAARALEQWEMAECIWRPADEIDPATSAELSAPPRLIVTSPPYPGVHVLYHRWQVQGRRETPAPYWIADSRDGDGSSYYTFGDRKQPRLTAYYDAAHRAFSALAKIADERTVVVQMIAFSDPTWQLPQYLWTLERAGFREVVFDRSSDSTDGRLWRNIPNRKFYADQKWATMASKEVVLFHRLA
jgi:hypothetical protein